MTEHASVLTGSLNRALELPAKLALCSQRVLNLRDLQQGTALIGTLKTDFQCNSVWLLCLMWLWVTESRQVTVETVYKRGDMAVQTTELEYRHIPLNHAVEYTPRKADCENLNVCTVWETPSMTHSKTLFPVELRDHETLLWLTKKDLLF